jgi:hypothetical protein
MWLHLHQLHQFFAFVDDGGAVAPGKYGCKKAGYFNILLFRKQVRNANGIVFNERRLIVVINLRIEQFF